MRDDKSETRYAYLDLLAKALADHEKNLGIIIERLEKVIGKLSGLNNQTKGSRINEAQETKATSFDEEVGKLLKEARDILSY